MVLKNREAYPDICFKVLADLEENLPEHLAYHCLEHTIDVANVCDFYIDHYAISKQMAELIRIAAISHDYGYMDSPIDHEAKSIEKITPLLKEHKYTDKEIDLIGGMIMATKIPQRPTNLYEEILADADLDYLGRGDYDELSSRLLKEFLYYDVVSNQKEWLDAQIKFLEIHRYHTDLAQKERIKTKLEKLKELKEDRYKLNGTP
ncbi:HD domain-containing protein [Aegicerativicinus sediminis]|uniref:HD domain-containing protein n=1 Tax=Aegicerativicinus sediminis TaxID=2893202 RepID=UPI001E3A969D|nr:HD domain-containing protein [Aegicerativicinus sediminis]